MCIFLKVWERTMPEGNVSVASEYCTSYQEFQKTLNGYVAVAIKVSAGCTNRVCNDATIANQIVAAFSNCTSNLHVNCQRKTFHCQGNAWKVGPCSLADSSGEIAIGKSGVSDLWHCQCLMNDVTVRPCSHSQAWGGVGNFSCRSPSTKLRIDVTLQGNSFTN